MGQPTTNPPGGGSWRWDAKADRWVENTLPAPAPEPTPVTAPTEQ